MADDVGVLSVSELETDRYASWIRVWVNVGDIRDAGAVGKSDPYWGRWGIEMRTRRKLCGFW